MKIRDKILAVIIAALALGVTDADARVIRPFKSSDVDVSFDRQEQEILVVPIDTLVDRYLEDHPMKPLPAGAFGPVVFDRYYFFDPEPRIEPAAAAATPSLQAVDEWLLADKNRYETLARAKQRYMIEHPELVKYNIMTLPDPPAPVNIIVDPRQHKVKTVRISSDEASKDAVVGFKINRRDWLHSFESQLQFTQSFLSPNWYQGGDGVINSLLNVQYGIKLNQKFHPKVMCEASVQYRLAMNNAPDDSIHAYNITEDLFRVIGKVGFKAFNHWFYSLNMQFKTQMLHTYAKNSRSLQSAFLSPAELNVGAGMTYTLEKPRVNFDASISPLSWNLKACTNPGIDPATFGIPDGKTVANQIGSSVECKFKWVISKTLTYNSRLYAFTDYSYLQGDWENTLALQVSSFFSAQIYAHLRYDSSVPKSVAKWGYWQMKEIFSIGFSYKFDTGK